MRHSAEKLIDFWKDAEVSSGNRRLHQEDAGEAILNLELQLTGNETVTAAERFLETAVSDDKGKLHLSLTPVPFVGDLRTADIFLLMINPFVGYADYGTDARYEFQAACKRTRDQDFSDKKPACFALDPQYWWTSWFAYYERLFRRVLWARTRKTGGTYRQALDELSRRLAILELVPYYSTNASRLTSKFVSNLGSANIIQHFARTMLTEAKEDRSTLIVRWNGRQDRWALNATPDEVRSIVRIEGRQGFSDATASILKRLEKPKR